jgi:hypothetical protein
MDDTAASGTETCLAGAVLRQCRTAQGKASCCARATARSHALRRRVGQLATQHMHVPHDSDCRLMRSAGSTAKDARSGSEPYFAPTAFSGTLEAVGCAGHGISLD